MERGLMDVLLVETGRQDKHKSEVVVSVTCMCLEPWTGEERHSPSCRSSVSRAVGPESSEHDSIECQAFELVDSESWTSSIERVKAVRHQTLYQRLSSNSPPFVKMSPVKYDILGRKVGSHHVRRCSTPSSQFANPPSAKGYFFSTKEMERTEHQAD